MKFKAHETAVVDEGAIQITVRLREETRLAIPVQKAD